MTGGILDAVLAGMLVWLAWRCLASANLFKGVVLFIAFGLVLAVAWARLEAPDVALAEAAIAVAAAQILMNSRLCMMVPPGLSASILVASAGGVNRRRPEHKRVTRQDGARRSYLNHQVTPAVNCIDFALPSMSKEQI